MKQAYHYSAQFLDKGVDMIRNILKDGVSRRLMTEDRMKQCLKALKASVDLKHLANVDLVSVLFILKLCLLNLQYFFNRVINNTFFFLKDI